MSSKLLEKIYNIHRKIKQPHLAVYVICVKSAMNGNHCVPFTYTTANLRAFKFVYILWDSLSYWDSTPLLRNFTAKAI